MTGRASVPTAGLLPDLTVGVLDSDVPATISFARVLPDSYTSHLPGSEQHIPLLTLDQEEKALVTDLFNVGSAGNGSTNCVAPDDPQRLTFYENKVTGDSGNPACLIIDGGLVLLTVWTFGGAGAGTSVTAYKAQINTLMAQLGSGYQLTEIDLSGYPSYT